jgi:hypothetical protein
VRRTKARIATSETFDPALWSIGMILSAAIVYLAWLN